MLLISYSFVIYIEIQGTKICERIEKNQRQKSNETSDGNLAE